MIKWRSESALDLYNLVASIFLLAAPWLFAHANQTAAIDLRTSGAVIAVLSLAAIVAFSVWEEWVNVFVGLWLIVSPWLLGFTHSRAMHFSIAAGAVVAFMALLELWLEYEKTHLGPSAARAPEKH
ncbi:MULTISPECIES: SPW repeat protein [unclassified Bradyrhizobium]|uniref:SPW repeat protein n=1 Tax=unclassified Bradyrhizobium TaxID=2631580 RepID=UPI002478D4A7|nr:MULTISPECIES: SPW repeat protein [unclassified Bradyrhizobium]WGR92882.1 SPW repeat protein [Bradyrhizobium sp. ISRA435]WGR97376.1 SPW repeat protein [Bradyrhizobium sp. ISRA436]WGS04264.1 SPW repeat protein [Bradyrhizobium sp. ISRA437]WGS11148.1 SPW repeat protein [Bradyrhizobium sp. ISRA443]WGS22896.1 SPW repeat protein [Bradyrhizobium sp. ISRA463]